MKTIKVIELINMIANGEAIPKAIKIRGNIFEWQVREEGTGYYNISEDIAYYWLEDYISLDNYDDLNTNIEIIEEGKPIEELKSTFTTFDIRDKINELVNIINEMKEGQG